MPHMIQFAMTSLEGQHLLARVLGTELPAPDLAEQLDRTVQERLRCAVTGKRFGTEKMAPRRQSRPRPEQKLTVDASRWRRS